MGPPETPTIHNTPRVELDQEPVSKMDIPEPVFTLGPSEPKPEPQDVLIGCIKVDIYSQSSGVTGNVNEDVMRVNTPSKQDIIGTASDSQIPRLEGSKGTESPQQNDCQIFICEVCEEEFNEEVFLLNHKLDSHWIPIEMSLTHLPGHKTCGNCRKYLSDSVEPNVAVFLTKTCKTCISGKCYTCEICTSHFYLSDHFKIALKLKLLNPTEQSRKKAAVPKHHTALSLTAGGQQVHHLLRPRRPIVAKVREYTCTDGSHSPNGFQPLLPTIHEQPAGLNVIERSDHTKKPKWKEAKEKPEAKHQQNSTSPKSPTKKPRQKKAKIIKSKTQVKADVKSKRNALDSAKIRDIPLEQTPIQRKKGKRKERIPKKKDMVLCSQCGKTFTEQRGLTKHMRTHSDERPFLCVVCNKSFMLKKYLKLHQRQHTGEKPFTCGKCGQGFVHKSSLRHHSWTHSETKQFQCDRCPKAFYRNADLQTHIRRHNGTFLNKSKTERRNVCDVCGKGYPDLYKLKIHLSIHRGECPYQCDACGKSFSIQYHLADHIINVHTEKTLPCPICGKMFPALVKLNRHHRLSHAEKSFKCQECTMAFISQKHLDRHMYRHTGKSPHVCENCGRRFSTGTYCRAHQKNCY